MESIKISRELLEKYIDNVLSISNRNEEGMLINLRYCDHSIYRDVLIPIYKVQNRDYEIIPATDDISLLLELIENNQLEQQYIDDIIEFSIANL